MTYVTLFQTRFPANEAFRQTYLSSFGHFFPLKWIIEPQQVWVSSDNKSCSRFWLSGRKRKTTIVDGCDKTVDLRKTFSNYCFSCQTSGIFCTGFTRRGFHLTEKVKDKKVPKVTFKFDELQCCLFKKKIPWFFGGMDPLYRWKYNGLG